MLPFASPQELAMNEPSSSPFKMAPRQGFNGDKSILRRILGAPQRWASLSTTKEGETRNYLFRVYGNIILCLLSVTCMISLYFTLFADKNEFSSRGIGRLSSARDRSENIHSYKTLLVAAISISLPYLGHLGNDLVTFLVRYASREPEPEQSTSSKDVPTNSSASTNLPSTQENKKSMCSFLLFRPAIFTKKDLLSSLVQFVMLIAIVIPNATLLILNALRHEDDPYQKMDDQFWLVSHIQSLVMCCASMFYIFGILHFHFLPANALLVNIFSCGLHVVHFVAPYYFQGNERSSTTIRILLLVFALLALFSFTFLSVKSVLHYYRILDIPQQPTAVNSNSTTPSKHIGRGKLQYIYDKEDQHCIVFSLIFSLWYVAYALVHLVLYLENLEYTSYFYIHILFMTTLGLIMNILTGGKDKQKATQAQNALETKRVFVRHVSHEIRTPLNTTILGLKLLEQELQSLNASGVFSAGNTVHSSPEHHNLAHNPTITPPHLVLPEKGMSPQSINSSDSKEKPVIPFIAGEPMHLRISQLRSEAVNNSTRQNLRSYSGDSEQPHTCRSIQDLSKMTGSIRINRSMLRPDNTDTPASANAGNGNQIQNNTAGGSLGGTHSMLMDLISDINVSCTIAVDILNDLLLYEKIDGGLLSLEATEINAWDFVIEVLKVFRIQARSANIALHWPDNPIEGYMIYADKYKLSQVLRNLISNALKFTPPDGTVMIDAEIITRTNPLAEGNSPMKSPYKSPQARARATYGGSAGSSSKRRYSEASLFPAVEMVRINVKDSGAGISKEDQRRLFHEIVQFDAEKLQQGKGSGLGLWISNKIVKLHGGNIGVYSEGQNSGSTFYVDIPISNYIQKNGQSLAAIDNTTLSYFESLVMTPRIGVINHSTVPNSSYSDKTDANASHLSKPPRKLMSTSDDDNSRRTVGTLKTSSNSSRLSFIFNSIRSSFSSGSGRDGRGGLKIGIAEGTRIKEEGDDIEQNVVSIRSTDNDSTILFANQPEADDASRSSGILSSSTPSTINHALSPGQVIGPGGLAATATAKPNSTMSIATTSEQSASSATSKINDGGLSNATSPNKASQTLTSPSRLGTRSNSGKLPASLNKRVLIVDDAPTNRKLINRLLRDRIMHRDEAVDGNDACEKLKKYIERGLTVDIVLLDYYMPNCDGPTAARCMRGMGYNNLIIGITGNGHEEDVQRFKDSGANHILMKPLNMDAFWAIVQDLLQESSSNQV